MIPSWRDIKTLAQVIVDGHVANLKLHGELDYNKTDTTALRELENFKQRDIDEEWETYSG